jgi:chromosomal replication initiation ATPase DnaA
MGSGSGWLDLHNTKAASGCRAWGDRIASKVAVIRTLACIMLTPRLIQTVAAEQYGLTHAQLLGRRRLPRFVLARHIAMLLCLEMLPGASLPQVGRWFHRDHTTVLHARDVMCRKIAADPKFAKKVEELRRIIKATHHRAA